MSAFELFEANISFDSKQIEFDRYRIIKLYTRHKVTVFLIRCFVTWNYQKVNVLLVVKVLLI